MRKHVKINVYGKVQGVRYRWSAKEIAEQLGLTGYVKNMPDGSVFIEAEGEEEDLHEFIDWCQIGPILAEVEQLSVEFSDNLKGFSEFESHHKRQQDYYYVIESRYLV